MKLYEVAPNSLEVERLILNKLGNFLKYLDAARNIKKEDELLYEITIEVKEIK